MDPTATRVAPGGTDQIETEWQFSAYDLGAAEAWLRAHTGLHGLTAGEPVDRDLRDTYFDTADQRVRRSGFALRIRTVDGRSEATLKALAAADDGPRVRREITQSLAEAHPRDLFVNRGPVGDRLRRLCKAGDLEPVVALRTERRTFPLHANGACAGELTLDRTSLLGAALEGSPPARHTLERVEVEAAPDRVAALKPFVESLRHGARLTPAGESKLEWAHRTLGLDAEWTPDLGPTRVEPAMTVGEVAFAVLRKHLGAFLRNEPGTRMGEDPEYLHDMRVASRRMRAALRVLKDALPPRATARYANELREVGRALGRVRDLDVQIEEIEKRRDRLVAANPGDLDPLIRRLTEEREAARDAMIDVLTAPRTRRMVKSLSVWVRRGPGRLAVAAVPARAAAPLLIRRARRRVNRAARAIDPSSPPAAYHELRIRCKRLRYTLEFVQPLYGDPAVRLIEALVDVQDCLGLHQDAQVSIDLLRRLAEDTQAPLPEKTAVAVGELTQLYTVEAEELRARFPKLYARLHGKRWRTMRRSMLDATEALAADLFRDARRRTAVAASKTGRVPSAPAGAPPPESPEDPWNS